MQQYKTRTSRWARLVCLYTPAPPSPHRVALRTHFPDPAHITSCGRCGDRSNFNAKTEVARFLPPVVPRQRRQVGVRSTVYTGITNAYHFCRNGSCCLRPCRRTPLLCNSGTTLCSSPIARWPLLNTRHVASPSFPPFPKPQAHTTISTVTSVYVCRACSGTIIISLYTSRIYIYNIHIYNYVYNIHIYYIRSILYNI